MSDREEYFEQARSWAADTRLLSARSRRIAWTVAGVAVAVAAFEALALALLTPLKTVQPITLLVDRQTGYVQALDPLTPRRIAADDALTNSFLAQYVTAREGFDRATVSASYRRVALWSAGRARQSYLAEMPATNPASPFQHFSAGTIVDARVKSVSRLNPGVALVRFDTQVGDRTGRSDPPQPWIAVVRFRYTDAPMRLEDRLVNPLGFQVLSYRRDAEAPPPPAIVQTVIASPPAAVLMPLERSLPPASSATQPRAVSPTASTALRRYEERSSAPQPYRSTSRGGGIERREVPVSNVPMGSPLAPSGRAVALTPEAAPR